MNINLFDFELPSNLIAQSPVEDRKSSKLMVVNRETNKIVHNYFYNIVDYLNPGDVLVLNNTRVIPARIYGRSEFGGSIEFLLVENIEDNLWEVMCKPGKRATIGKKFYFGDEYCLEAEVVDIKDDGNRIVRLVFDGYIYDILDRIGNMPLPPYIKEVLCDKERYQTVYSDKVGSIAAPTAGLHFTKDLLDRIKSKGIYVVYVTLHVGLGTFMPVKVDDIDSHVMHSEKYEVTDYVANIINNAKEEGRRVIGVGTTTVRVLETIANRYGKIIGDSGSTDIFIKPGYKFKVIDSLVTNFHLPKSTLIILISAFYDRERVLDAYEEAIVNNYRFFSFGDSMFII